MFVKTGSKHVDFQKLYHQTAQQAAALPVVRALPPVKRRARRIRLTGLFRFGSSLIGLLAMGVIAGTLYAAYTAKLIYQNVSAAKTDAETAVVLMREQDFPAAVTRAKQAEIGFTAALVPVARWEGFFATFPVPGVTGQVREVAGLLRAATVLSRVLATGAELGTGFQAILGERRSFAELPRADKSAVLKLLSESGEELAAVESEVDEAVTVLQRVKATGVLRPFKARLTALETDLNDARSLMADSLPISRLLPAMLGYPGGRQYLLLLQNSDELRPTGGFLGTYGILKTDGGDIVRLDTHDVYHLDMPVKDTFKREPPLPIKKYLVPNWYLRDANWSPDWPTSARTIEEFFFAEDKLLPPKDRINNVTGPFDGIIGITPAVVTDLLTYTGPVAVEGTQYTADNFTDLLEYRVEKGYVQAGVSSWQRKEVIGTILKELERRVSAMPVADLVALYRLFVTNLAEKNIILSFRDETLMTIARDQKWAGAVEDTGGDFVMLVDANMGALKTDAVISRKLEYKLEVRSDGAYGDLTVYYAHRGEGKDWRTAKYRSYARVYVPLGASLIRAGGQSEGSIETGEELGKTVFSALVDVEPGAIGRLHLYYKLPDPVTSQITDGNYRLNVSRQPGSVIEGLTVDANFNTVVEQYEPTGFSAEYRGDAVTWNADLNTDKEFGVILKR